MQSLNAQFKQAIVENLYNCSNFNGKQYPLEDLQICHILSNSDNTVRHIVNKYGCAKKIAILIKDMPLFNTVVGSIKQNAYYDKTEDINFIDYEYCHTIYNSILIDLFKQNKELSKIKLLNEFYTTLKDIVETPAVIFPDYCFKEINENDVRTYIITNIIKDIQLQFHKEIDLHF